VFNDMITPLADITISEGTIQRLDMHITGDSRRAAIDMTFLYDDLKAGILREKDGRLKERRFLSNIVNHLVLTDSNPRRNHTRTAHQVVYRDPLRSPFNYLWRAVFAATKETIGLGRL
jgi:hypothetical protein